MPPNGHGIVALMALGMLEGMGPGAYGEAETVHRQLEAMKLAFADGKRYVADPAYMKVTTEQMLSETYLSARRALIGSEALTPACGDPACGGTVYLCAADGEGNMVSWIQSNYMGFGSGIVVPGTGIALNDRGANFSLNEGEENCLGPGKKSYHTIIPGFLTRQGRAVGPFGVMGGFMQPQGHVQVIMNTLDYHMNPQEALDAPRWQWVGEKKIQVEAGFDGETVRELQRRGHEVTVMEDCETLAAVRLSGGMKTAFWPPAVSLVATESLPPGNADCRGAFGDASPGGPFRMLESCGVSAAGSAFSGVVDLGAWPLTA